MKSKLFLFCLSLFANPLLAQLHKGMTVFNIASEELHFIENKGQITDQFSTIRDDINFVTYDENLSIFLSDKGLSYQFVELKENNQESVESADNRAFSTRNYNFYRVDVSWVGINKDFRIEAQGVSSASFNYKATSKENAVTGVKSYEVVYYRNIYENIDLKWYSREGRLEYDFIVQPNSDYRNIKWSVSGSKKISINDRGDLVLTTDLGEIIEQAPIAFQNNEVLVSRWKIEDDVIGFEIEEYNPNEVLVIDPMVRHWGTYFGGTADEEITDSEVDQNGNIIVTGYTFSTSNIATSGSHQNTLSAKSDAFISKFNSNGSILWASYFGDTSTDVSNACSIDQFNNIYIAGITGSDDNIATPNTHQDSLNGPNTAFLAKFDPSGSIIWSTYYNANTYGEDVAASAQGNVYLVGRTGSSTGIGTTGSFNPTNFNSTCYIAKFDSSGTRLWGTYYGRTWSRITACAADNQDNIYIVGWATNGSAYYTTTGCHQSTHGGSDDGFVAKFSPSGSRLWATYYGGSTIDHIVACAVDDSSNLIFAGNAISGNNISTPNSHQPVKYRSMFTGFAVKFDSSGTRKWGTYHYMWDLTDCTVDDNYNVYIAGKGAPSWPHSRAVTTNAYDSLGSGGFDGQAVKFGPGGKRHWATFYGGSSDEYLSAISTYGDLVYLVGLTESNSGIATAGAHQNSRMGLKDGFIAQLGNCVGDVSSQNVTRCDSYTSPSGKHTWTSSGAYHDTLSNWMICDSIVNINLTINNSTSSSVDVTSCFSYSSPSNKFQWTESGVYFDTISNSKGCDSSITFNLTIDTVDTRVSQSMDTLESMALNSSYQWMDCSDTSILSNETNSSFIAGKNGFYAVILTQNGCTDTSDCFEIIGVGQGEPSNIEGIKLFPNPANESVFIDFNKPYQNAELTLVNAQNQILGKWNYNRERLIKISIDQSPGLYFLIVNLDGTLHRLPVVHLSP